MNLSRRNKFLTLLGLFCIWIACLGLLDHKFLIGNKKFSICHIYSDLPYKKSWEVKAPLSEEIVQQPFFYLGRGHQTYAFVSQDNRYVMKFYRFPSHLRPFGWMNHLFGGKRRRKIVDYNLQKLEMSFQSYKIAFEKLKEASGLLYLHLNHTTDLKKQVHLVDHLGSSYQVNLDDVAFLIQKKESPFFETLETLIEQGKGKKAIANFFQLIDERCRQGISDQDPILEKNYGWDGERPLHLDVGRFATDLKDAKEERIRVTESLKMWLEKRHPELLPEYLAHL